MRLPLVYLIGTPLFRSGIASIPFSYTYLLNQNV